jgi:4-alpha-glucanotransferase
MPIFIAYDSADLWANKHLFTVDEKGILETVAAFHQIIFLQPVSFGETHYIDGKKWRKMILSG